MSRRGAIVAVVAGALIGVVSVLTLPEAQSRRALPPPEHQPASLPVTRPAVVDTLLAWSPTRLAPRFATAARKLPGVHRVAVVRSGVAWLSGWQAGDGSTNRVPGDLAMPVEVASVTPKIFRGFVPSGQQAPVDALAGGGAVISRSEARLRGADEGGRLVFGKISLPVVGVIDDELLGAHEVLVSDQTGRRLGIRRPRYLLVEPDAGARRERIERGLHRALPPGIRLRVRGPGETPVFRQGDAVLPPLRLKQLFGEFSARRSSGGFLKVDRRWVAEHIRTARVPILGRVTCHRKLLPQLRAALREVTERGLDGKIDPAQFGGCYSPRYADRDPGSALSHHAWGVALDINVSENAQGRQPRMDERVVEIFERWGFTWGGRWLIPDGMHFEFLSFPAAE